MTISCFTFKARKFNGCWEAKNGVCVKQLLKYTDNNNTRLELKSRI